MAISYEYDFKVEKLNDNYIKSIDESASFVLSKNIHNWRFLNEIEKKSFFYKFCLKIYIRIIHCFYYIYPRYRSYKIALFGNNLKFLFGEKLKNDFNLSKIIEQAKNTKVIVSGWGLRDWNLVLKHKKLITKDIENSIKKNNIKKHDYKIKNYILVHIRKGDFLKIREYKNLNFSEKIWLDSILKICTKKSIKKIVMFSDERISKEILLNLKNNGIETIVPEVKNDYDFLLDFIQFVENASIVICNASTLIMSISFLFHKMIYLPSSSGEYKKIFLDEAHYKNPTCLNWN